MPFKKLLKKSDKKSTAKKPALTKKTRAGKKRLAYSNKFSYNDLINAESALGRTLFGPIPAGHRREFFEHKKNVWIWHESFINSVGKLEEMTIRYEVRPTGVYKKPLSGHYEQLQGEELENFRQAAHRYLDLVKTKLYC